jgi:hypothetical protein
MASGNFEINCPCCESLIVIDRLSGAILLHKPKETKQGLSLDAMVSNLETQKSDAEKRFERQLESQRDRSRLLEERFKEAVQRAEKSDTKPINPMDLD